MGRERRKRKNEEETHRETGKRQKCVRKAETGRTKEEETLREAKKRRV